MPRTTGVDILNIKPDAEMGLAQDTSIPVPAVALDQVNKASDDLRLYDHQINLMKYQQKIKDRDRLLEGLEAGEVAVGDIEPEDRKYFDEAENKAHQSFLSVKSLEPDEKGQNKEYAQWKKDQQDLKDVSNQLQARRKALQDLRIDLAKTISPSERKAKEKHLAEQKAKGPYETITPFQKSLTVDLDKTLASLQEGALISDTGEAVNVPQTTTTVKDANGKITTTTTQKPPAGAKGVTKAAATVATQPQVGPDGMLSTEILLEPGKKWSLPSITQRAHQLYLEPSGEGFAQIQGVYDIFNGNPDDIPKNYLKTANKRLVDFHTQNEIGTIKIADPRPGPPSEDPNDTVGKVIDTGEYPHQINYRVLPDGRIQVLDNPADFAAKLALANASGDYVIKPKKGFSEEAFKLNMENAKNKAEIMLKGAQAQTEKAKAGWYWQKMKDLKDDEKQTKLIQDGYRQNLFTQKELVLSDNSLVKIPNQLTTPVFTFGSDKNGSAKPTILRPIGSEIIYGTDPANPATFGKVVGYKGGYYEQEYQFNGKPLTTTSMKGMYDTFVSSSTEDQRSKWGINSFDDYVKSQIQAKIFDVKLVGENGSTNENFHTQAMKKSMGSTKNMAEFYSENPEQ